MQNNQNNRYPDRNQATIAGRLGQDPQISVDKNGRKSMTFSLAVGHGENVSWIPVRLRGPWVTDWRSNNLKKGVGVEVSGAFVSQTYTNQAGEKKSSTFVEPGKNYGSVSLSDAPRNIVSIDGRLTKDPEAFTTSTGKSAARASIAVNLGEYTKSDGTQGDLGTSFINLTLWDKVAESILKNGRKGDLLAVDGYLRSHKYTTQAGENRTAYDVIATSCFKKKFANTPAAPVPANAAAPAAAPAPTPQNQSYTNDEYMAIEFEDEDEDLPF